MKQAVRWIGIGITVAAAATMLLADVALAASPTAAARAGGLQAAMPHDFPSTRGRTADEPVAYRRAGEPVTTIVDAGP